MSELVLRIPPEDHLVLRTMAESAETEFERFVRESVDLGFACADLVLANQLLDAQTYAFYEDEPEKFRQVSVDFMPGSDKEAVQSDPEQALDVPLDPFSDQEPLNLSFSQTLEDEIHTYVALLSTTPEAFLVESFNLRWGLERVMQAGRKMYVNDEAGKCYIEIGRTDQSPNSN